jgi:hypothetical protein
LVSSRPGRSYLPRGKDRAYDLEEGYNNDVLNAAGQPQMLPTPGSMTEAQKTEPDKNTYLVFRNGLSGADPDYRYGVHFLFQGHELGVDGHGYITRINLDADAAHRVTLLATTDANGDPLSVIDGSTWDPWAKRLLFTTENDSAPTYSATPGCPSTVTDISGSLGRGGYEGIQNDSAGNVWIVEDTGGAFKGNTTGKRPNSFVYRFVPTRPGDLGNGKLQALQVLNHAGDPITFDSQAALNSPDQMISFVEDAGDTLHTQRNALDSGYVLDTNADYSMTANQPLRWLAQGRDASATIDSAFGGFGKNEGDNEITGIHVSDGDPSVRGILGAKVPNLGNPHWRWFYTQQHGDNSTCEVVLKGQRVG